MLNLYDFAGEVAEEREHQADRFGDGTEEGLDRTDQEHNGPMEFTCYIVAYVARWFSNSFPPYDENTILEFRRYMVKVAALAYAGARWADWKLEQHDKESDHE